MTLELFATYDVALLVLGVATLGVAALLRRVAGEWVSFPAIVLLLGVVAFGLPLGLPTPDPLAEGPLALRLTELAVIVSLMGVGLKIDRVPTWRGWASTWRLLGVTMPLTIAAAALLGWWVLGLAPAAALLLGAVLAPTDPVLASDVQVGEPLAAIDDRPEEPDDDREGELRFALTSEAGLNDALAFPFTYLALHVATHGGDVGAWLGTWLLVDVAYRVVVGLVVGLALGAGLGRLLLSLSRDSERDRGMTGVGALAATLVVYGITEALSGYGFLAVFVAALTIRHRESRSDAHRSLHVFSEQAEQLLMALVLLLVGGAVATGALASLTPAAVLVAVLVVLVVRPLAGWLALLGSRRMDRVDRAVTSAYGIRGVGSLFYLAYAVDEHPFGEAGLLWSLTLLVVVLSVVLHGSTAPPVMAWRDRRREAAG